VKDLLPPSVTIKPITVAVAATGFMVPFAARIPGGGDWVWQYVEVGPGGWLFLELFNGVAVLTAVIICFVSRQRLISLIPAASGYSFLCYAHGGLDLGSDAQEAVALAFIPFYSLPYFLAGAAVAGVLWWVGRSLRRKADEGTESKASK